MHFHGFLLVTYQVLAFLLVSLEQEAAPPMVTRKTSLPLCKAVDHNCILAFWFPWIRNLVIAEHPAGNCSPEVMGLDECCKQGPTLIGDKTRVLEGRGSVLECCSRFGYLSSGEVFLVARQQCCNIAS